MEQKTNILSFKFSLTLGGGERFNLLLGKELSSRGYKIRFFSNHIPFIKRLREEGLAAKRLYWGNELGARRNIPEYLILLPFNVIRFFFILFLNKEKGPRNIVLFQNLNEKIFATRIAKMLGYKVFWIEHLSAGSWLKKNILKNSYLRLSKKTDKVVVVSNAIKNDLLGLGVLEDKIEVIHNGVDLKGFFPLDQSGIKKEKGKYDLNDDSIIIGYSGRIHSEKGLKTLIESFYQINSHHNNIRLVLIGDGPEKNKLKEFAKSFDIEKKVIFFGHQDDVPLFLNLIDVFVLPSIVRESFGMSIVEAMAIKKVVIASNIGGIPEIIDHNVNGLLFEPGNVKELTDCLIRVLSDDKLKKDLSEKAFEKVNKYFSSEVMTNKFERLFRL